MVVSFQRLYRNSSFLITAIGVGLGSFLLARGYGGYLFDQQKLGLFSDLALSAGLFLAGLPLLTNLVLPEKCLGWRQSAQLQRLTFALQMLGLILSLTFVFVFDNQGYVGFIQLPVHGQGLFLLALTSSTISALMYLTDRLMSAKKCAASRVIFPVVLLVSSCGVALSLLMMQTVGLFSEETKVYTATVPLNEFFVQTLVVAALAAFVSRLIAESEVNRAFYTLVLAISSSFLLIGFQASALMATSNDGLYILNQGASSIGLSGYVGLTGILLFRDWRRRGRDLLENGTWVPHFIFLLGLLLTLLLQMGSGRLLLSFGPLDNLRLALLIFAAPLTLIRSVDHRPLYSQVTRSMVSALHWCGIFVVALATLMVAPHGGTLIGIGNDSFRSFYGVAVSGFFLIAASYAVILWDKILGEAI